MMGFLSSIKAYIAGFFVLVIGVLAATARHFWKQRNRARRESERLKRRAEAEEKRRQWERKIHDTQNEIKKENREHAQKERDRIDAGNRPDHWGDSRMRGKD